MSLHFWRSGSVRFRSSLFRSVVLAGLFVFSQAHHDNALRGSDGFQIQVVGLG